MEKLTSRKFWVAVVTAAYFALMAIKEQGVNSTLGTVIFGALAAFVAFGYVALETWLDHDNEEEIPVIEEEYEEDDNDEGKEEEAN